MGTIHEHSQLLCGEHEGNIVHIPLGKGLFDFGVVLACPCGKHEVLQPAFAIVQRMQRTMPYAMLCVMPVYLLHVSKQHPNWSRMCVTQGMLLSPRSLFFAAPTAKSLDSASLQDATLQAFGPSIHFPSKNSMCPGHFTGSVGDGHLDPLSRL